MGKSKGFTLIELIVSMAIMAIIMGALVQLFGTSVSHEITGFNQQEMYAQARRLENDLKNTLRYNYDKRYSSETLKFWTYFDKEITADDRSKANYIDKLKYNSIIYNNAKKCNQKIEVLVEWVDNSNKKQIKVVKKISDEKINDAGEKIYTGNTEERYVFPENIENSAFEGNFPVTVIPQEDNEATNSDIHSGMLKIKLPFRYKAAGTYKTNELETKVAFNEISSPNNDGAAIVTLGNDGAYLEFNGNFNSSSNIIMGGSYWNNHDTVKALCKNGYNGTIFVFREATDAFGNKMTSDKEKQWLAQHVSFTLDTDNLISKNKYDKIPDYAGKIPSTPKTSGELTSIDKSISGKKLYSYGKINLKKLSVQLSEGSQLILHCADNESEIKNCNFSGKGEVFIFASNPIIKLENLDVGKDVSLIVIARNNGVRIKSCNFGNSLIYSGNSGTPFSGDCNINGLVVVQNNKINCSGNITINGYPNGVNTAFQSLQDFDWSLLN